MLKRCLEDESVEVVTEALNSLFDVYGNEDHDGVFFAAGLLETARSVSASLGAKLKRDKKRLDPDVRERAREMRENLLRFIEYKEEHRGK